MQTYTLSHTHYTQICQPCICGFVRVYVGMSNAGTIRQIVLPHSVTRRQVRTSWMCVTESVFVTDRGESS